MPPVKLVILIIEAAFSLLSSRLRYLEESRLRKRNKLETERERGEERRVSNVSTSTKGLFWSGFNLNFYIYLSPDFLNQLHKISSGPIVSTKYTRFPKMSPTKEDFDDLV